MFRIPHSGIIFLYWFDEWHGERAWKRYKAAAASRGTKLYLSDYEQSSVPDAENYAAAPIFRRLIDPDTREETLKLPHPRRPNPDESASTKTSSLLGPDPLILYQDAFVEDGSIPTKSASPAEDVLAGLDYWNSTFDEIREASQRPRSDWPAELNQIGFPNFSYCTPLLGVTTTLRLRALALLALQRTDEALSEMKHILRVARSLEDEPALLPFLVRFAIWSMWCDVAERGIVAEAWNDQQLQSLSEECAKIDVLGALTHALDSERTFANQFHDLFAAADRGSMRNLLRQAGADSSVEATMFVLLMPRGWIRRSQAEYNRLIDLNLEDIQVSKGTISPQFSRSARIAESYATTYQRLTHILIDSAFSTAEGTAYKAAYVHTQFQQVRVECALARYRGEHGGLPPSLDLLVPAFLDQVPTDVMAGNPLRYRRTDAGGGVICSVAQNRIDDGGDTASNRLRHNSPDWVSELPP